MTTKDLIALTLPGDRQLEAPPGVPTGLDIGQIATAALSVAMAFGIILSLLYLTYGGFHWIQSKGDKETLDKSRRIILYSILGLIIMSLALVIVNVVATALGVETVFTPGPRGGSANDQFFQP